MTIGGRGGVGGTDSASDAERCRESRDDVFGMDRLREKREDLAGEMLDKPKESLRSATLGPVIETGGGGITGFIGELGWARSGVMVHKELGRPAPFA